MDQGQMVQVAPTDAELQRAIASVPGVVSADIDRSVATGQSRMRLRLAPGEDEETVAWSVAATLRERFGIALDPDAIRPRPTGSVSPEGVAAGSDAAVDRPRSDGPSADVGEPRSRSSNERSDTRERLRLAAAQAFDGDVDLNDLDDLDAGSLAAGSLAAGSLAAGSLAAGSLAVGSVFDDAVASEREVDPAPRSRNAIPRAVIRDLQVHRDARSVRVAVVLGHGDRAEEGWATSAPTAHGTLRAVAEATVASLRGLTEGPLLVGIDRVSASHGDDAPIATVVLSLLTHRGEERLLGASIMYDSPERAILRATLDALNRRVMPLLA